MNDFFDDAAIMVLDGLLNEYGKDI